MNGISGTVCLSANHVGEISAASGTAHIKANSMDSLSVTSGTTHLYGTRVLKVHTNSGRICLHDGAQVVSVGRSSGTVSDNCDDN